MRVRYGYRRVHVLLDREGWEINIKKVYRIYKELGTVKQDIITVRVCELWLRWGKGAVNFDEQPSRGEDGRAAQKLIAREPQRLTLL